MTAARSMCSTVSRELSEHGLKAGVGLHFGPVVEGLIGTPEQQSYDLLGESVNTAKRLCDHAGGGEVLISGQALEQLADETQVGTARQLTGKGISTPITAYSLNPLV